MSRGLRVRGAHRYAQQDRRYGCPVARMIGIDTGKNTLHFDWSGREGCDRFAREGLWWPDCSTACQHAAVPDWHRGSNGDNYVARELIALGHEVFCSDRQTGQSTASDRGLRPQHGACITMFWQPPWPTSWHLTHPTLIVLVGISCSCQNRKAGSTGQLP